MKTFTLYISKANIWFVEHSMKNTNKPRRFAVSGSVVECKKRFEKLGYKFIDKYQHENLIGNN